MSGRMGSFSRNVSAMASGPMNVRVPSEPTKATNGCPNTEKVTYSSVELMAVGKEASFNDISEAV